MRINKINFIDFNDMVKDYTCFDNVYEAKIKLDRYGSELDFKYFKIAGKNYRTIYPSNVNIEFSLIKDAYDILCYAYKLNDSDEYLLHFISVDMFTLATFVQSVKFIGSPGGSKLDMILKHTREAFNLYDVDDKNESKPILVQNRFVQCICLAPSDHIKKIVEEINLQMDDVYSDFLFKANDRKDNERLIFINKIKLNNGTIEYLLALNDFKKESILYTDTKEDHHPSYFDLSNFNNEDDLRKLDRKPNIYKKKIVASTKTLSKFYVINQIAYSTLHKFATVHYKTDTVDEFKNTLMIVLPLRDFRCSNTTSLIMIKFKDSVLFIQRIIKNGDDDRYNFVLFANADGHIQMIHYEYDIKDYLILLRHVIDKMKKIFERYEEMN